MLLSDFRLTPPAPVAANGVLFCCVIEQKNSSRAAAARGELAVAAQALAQQQGAGTSWQRMLVSDAHTSRWLEALAPTPRWEVHRSVNGVARRNEQFLRRHPKLDRKSAGFVWKLAALLLSRPVAEDQRLSDAGRPAALLATARRRERAGGRPAGESAGGPDDVYGRNTAGV